MKNLITTLGIILLVVALVILGPLLFLWALNTLFPVLAIPYTLATWFACIVVFGATRSQFKVTRS